MSSINAFLVRQNVDVGRALSILTLSSAVTSFYGVIGQLMTGHISIDLSVPLGLFVGVALWLHVSWARKLLVLVGWLAVGVVIGALVLFPFAGTGRLTLTLGSTVITHPPLWQPYVLAVLAAPIVWLFLTILHSEKARSEFQEPNQSLEPTTMGVTPPAAQEPRQP